MKTRFLALLMCLILVASSFLFTGCGKKKEKEAEVVAPEEREVALAGFLRGVEALRESGVVFTGSLNGAATKEDGTESPIDLSLALNYNNKNFRATANGAVDGKTGTFELYFDNVLLATLSTEDGSETDGDVFFLEDVLGLIPPLEIPLGEIDLLPSTLNMKVQLGKDGNYSDVADKLIGLLDLDAIAGRINSSAADVLVIMKSKSNYKIIVTSDAIFDAVIAALNTVKASGEKTVGELFDDLAGGDFFAQLKAELESRSGTDKIDALLSKIEALLGDCGVNMNAVYQYAAESAGLTGEGAGEQLKSLLQIVRVNMTIDDALLFAEKTLQNQLNPGSAADVDDPITYERIKETILSFIDAKVIDTLAGSKGSDFDLSAEVDSAIGKIEEVKEAVKFDMTATCDKDLNPIKFEWNASVDGTKLPRDEEKEEKENFNITLNLTAEVRSSVTVAPSEALQEKIDAAKEARETDPDTEGEND